MTTTELIRDFVNTRELLEDEEELGLAGRARGWLDGARPDARRGASASAGDLRRAIELREALRRLLLEHTGVEVDPRTRRTSVLDRAARRARVELGFERCSGASSLPRRPGSTPRSAAS